MVLKRRDAGLALVLVLVLVLLAPTLAAEGQQTTKVYRLGYLGMSSGPDGTRLDSLRQALRDLGYLEGRNIAFEIRYAEGKPERLPDLAAELVGRNIDLIVTATGRAAVAAKNATQAVPIVMLGSGDAVRQGLVASLAHPGGNVTGLTAISPELSRKRLELLRELVPKLSLVGVVGCGRDSPVGAQEWAESQAAAAVLGVRLFSLEVRGRADLPSAFASAVKHRVQAIVVFDCQQLIPHLDLIAQLSLKHRLPTMCPYGQYPQVGGLMRYGASVADAPRRARGMRRRRMAASYVDKILRTRQTINDVMRVIGR
jgi:putative ABC transport system substrate-binding protein